MRLTAIALIWGLASSAGALSPLPSPQAAARTVLDAYAAGDAAALDRMVEPQVAAYGGDISEVARGREALHAMLADDLKLWGGPASIGPMAHLTTIQEGAIAVVTFDAPFTARGGKPIPVRFTIVLRRHGDRWLLVESANATPTTGQSARELLQTAR